MRLMLWRMRGGVGAGKTDRRPVQRMWLNSGKISSARVQIDGRMENGNPRLWLSILALWANRLPILMHRLCIEGGAIAAQLSFRILPSVSTAP
jgi:hypothetical protein